MLDGRSFDCVVASFANENFARNDRGYAQAIHADLARPSARPAAMLFVLLDDEMIGHTGDVIAHHAGQ